MKFLRLSKNDHKLWHARAHLALYLVAGEKKLDTLTAGEKDLLRNLLAHKSPDDMVQRPYWEQVMYAERLLHNACFNLRQDTLERAGGVSVAQALGKDTN